MTLCGINTEVWFSPLFDLLSKQEDFCFIIPGCQHQWARSEVTVCRFLEPSGWTAILPITAHQEYRLLVPLDWALFIPLVLLIRPRHASAYWALAHFILHTMPYGRLWRQFVMFSMDKKSVFNELRIMHNAPLMPWSGWFRFSLTEVHGRWWRVGLECRWESVG